MRTPLNRYHADRIALIKPSALGDIVHSLPVLTALRRRYPDAHITWVVNRAYEPLLQGHPDLNATLTVDRSAGKKSWRQAIQRQFTFLRDLRRSRFDLVIDLQGLFRSGVMSLLSGAARRVGLNSAREGASWGYTDTIEGADRLRYHAVDRYWRVAEALGVGDVPKEFRVPVQPEAMAWARAMLANYPRPWLTMAVGARWLTKRWPPEHFAELARRAQERAGGTLVLVGAPEEVNLAEQTAQLYSGKVLQLAGATTLPQLTAILACADVMVSNDTGPLHLAAALGRPVVAPYTCTRAGLTGPYSPSATAIQTRVWCAGSLQRRCSRMECMRELTPDRLWPSLEGILMQWLSTRQTG